jgi:hypothetical protein
MLHSFVLFVIIFSPQIVVKSKYEKKNYFVTITRYLHVSLFLRIKLCN